MFEDRVMIQRRLGAFVLKPYNDTDIRSAIRTKIGINQQIATNAKNHYEGLRRPKMVINHSAFKIIK